MAVRTLRRQDTDWSRSYRRYLMARWTLPSSRCLASHLNRTTASQTALRQSISDSVLMCKCAQAGSLWSFQARRQRSAGPQNARLVRLQAYTRRPKQSKSQGSFKLIPRRFGISHSVPISWPRWSSTSKYARSREQPQAGQGSPERKERVQRIMRGMPWGHAYQILECEELILAWA